MSSALKRCKLWTTWKNSSSSHLNPQWLDCPRTPLIDGQAVGKVNNLVLSAMNYQYRGGDSRDLVDTEIQNNDTTLKIGNRGKATSI